MLAELLRKKANSMPANWLRHLGNLWRPFRGAGIRIVYVSPDYRDIKVQMKLRWYNRNYVGTHFGGSLYAMTDPFFMMMLINNLGKDYIVWDKGAKIDFIKPGRGTVNVRFQFSKEELADIKTKADNAGKYVFDRSVEITGENDEIVATVVKTLYVRKKTV